jgi:hypothetical protein
VQWAITTAKLNNQLGLRYCCAYAYLLSLCFVLWKKEIVLPPTKKIGGGESIS